MFKTEGLKENLLHNNQTHGPLQTSNCHNEQ